MPGSQQTFIEEVCSFNAHVAQLLLRNDWKEVVGLRSDDAQTFHHFAQAEFAHFHMLGGFSNVPLMMIQNRFHKLLRYLGSHIMKIERFAFQIFPNEFI